MCCGQALSCVKAKLAKRYLLVGRQPSVKRPEIFSLFLVCGTVAVLLAPAAATAQFAPGSWVDRETSEGRARARTDRSKSVTIDEYVQRLSDDEPQTRLEAVRSLGASKDPKAIEHLLTATADADIRVKVKAIEYLGILRATDATPALAQQLFLRDVGLGVKQKVLVALGKIGDPRGAEPIMDFLKRDLDLQLTSVALFALGEVGSEQAIAFLDSFSGAEHPLALRQLATHAASDIRSRLSPEFTPVVPTFIKQVELRTKAERGELPE
jgi:HEAT repeat protein